MDLDLRRRAMMGGSPYPFISDYPEFTEYGSYYLKRVTSVGTGNTNTFLKSGSTNYQYCGGALQTLGWYRIVIDESKIKIYSSASNGLWFEKDFAGFPVGFKRCDGAVNNPPLVTFKVTKEV